MASKTAPSAREDVPAGPANCAGSEGVGSDGPIGPESSDFPASVHFAPETANDTATLTDIALRDGAEITVTRNSSTGLLSGRVLVLNASFEPINVCTVKRAIVLILKEKAEVIDEQQLELHAEKLSMSRPSVIRLVTYVRIPFQSFRRKITRRAVFARDGWECQYCGRRGSLTMDHVVPRSKGGPTTWENVVACCAGCNRRKGDRSVSQAGMKLRSHPRAPHATIFIHVASPTIPASWRPFVPEARSDSASSAPAAAQG